MDVLHTPDGALDGLPGWPLVASHVTVDAGTGPLRLAVWEVGEGPTVLLLHGEPSWAYLYRHMVPPLVAAGCRVVAPDLIGFGASDKPTERGDHTYARHVAWLRQALFETLDLRDVVMFCQDWGGLLGLRCVTAAPERFSGVVIANTGLPTGDQTPAPAVEEWQRFAATADPFPVAGMVQSGTRRALTEGEVAAYDAPFPDDGHTAGPRVLPSLVPTTPDDPEAVAQRDAWRVLRELTVPVLTAFSDGDPLTAGGERVFQRLVPGAAGQPHRTVGGAGHFLQEDAPAACVEAVLELRLR